MAEKKSKQKEAPMETSAASIILDAYFRDEDSGRFTSLEVCDNLIGTIALSPDEVTTYLLQHGWKPVRIEDRMVWEK